MAISPNPDFDNYDEGYDQHGSHRRRYDRMGSSDEYDEYEFDDFEFTVANKYGDGEKEDSTKVTKHF